MKQLLLLLTFTSSFIALSQEKLQMITGISGFFEKELGMISNEGDQVYGGGELYFGLRFIQDKGMLDASLVYQFSTNVNYYAHADSTSFDGKYYKKYDSNGKEMSSYKSLLRSHFMGLSLKYSFGNSSKVIKPFIMTQILSEISTNYKNGYLLEDFYIPREEPWGKGKMFEPFYSHLYYSTPLVSSVSTGIDIRLMQNLNLNIGVGYGFRIMKVKSVRWNEGEDYREIAKNISTSSVYSHMFDFELGVSYAIPVKSGRKSKE
ncbi:MAG: hypothetical protein H3C31_10360 [Brumimicrobium sp.]|nr:hypothetical protein [Brumimicrobium sp.]